MAASLFLVMASTLTFMVLKSICADAEIEMKKIRPVTKFLVNIRFVLRGL
jgi:hypothetical protein